MLGRVRTDGFEVARSLLITGTDTGIGKTTVASAIAAALRRRGHNIGVIKPVETGCEAGVRWLADRRPTPCSCAGRPGATIRSTSSARFGLREPLAPSVAAHREGAVLGIRAIVVRHVRAMIDALRAGPG